MLESNKIYKQFFDGIESRERELGVLKGWLLTKKRSKLFSEFLCNVSVNKFELERYDGAVIDMFVVDGRISRAKRFTHYYKVGYKTYVIFSAKGRYKRVVVDDDNDIYIERELMTANKVLEYASRVGVEPNTFLRDLYEKKQTWLWTYNRF